MNTTTINTAAHTTGLFDFVNVAVNTSTSTAEVEGEKNLSFTHNYKLIEINEDDAQEFISEFQGNGAKVVAEIQAFIQNFFYEGDEENGSTVNPADALGEDAFDGTAIMNELFA